MRDDLMAEERHFFGALAYQIGTIGSKSVQLVQQVLGFRAGGRVSRIEVGLKVDLGLLAVALPGQNARRGNICRWETFDRPRQMAQCLLMILVLCRECSSQQEMA